MSETDLLLQIINRLDIIIEGKFQTHRTNKFYTVAEVAQMFKVSRDTIERAIRNNQLHASKIGDWRISQEQIDSWVKARSTKAKK